MSFSIGNGFQIGSTLEAFGLELGDFLPGAMSATIDNAKTPFNDSPAYLTYAPIGAPTRSITDDGWTVFHYGAKEDGRKGWTASRAKPGDTGVKASLPIETQEAIAHCAEKLKGIARDTAASVDKLSAAYAYVQRDLRRLNSVPDPGRGLLTIAPMDGKLGRFREPV